MTASPAEPPTSAEEDWRYVDCRPLAEPAAPLRTELPGAPCGADAFPAPADATHAWALAGPCRALVLDRELALDDRGGSWALAVRVPAGARARLVVRRHPAAGRSASWICATLGAGARLELRDEGGEPLGVHLAAWTLALDGAAEAVLGVVQAGGRLQRQRIDARLAGAHASLRLVRVAELAGERQAHLLTRVEHAVGPSLSRQLAKAVLDGAARSSFDGLVTVCAGADGSDAAQRDHHLLRSSAARADTRPQLDIRADEVQAAHGATIGRLDADELLYLRQRGLPLPDAERLLIAAFLAEAREQLP